MEPIVFGIVGTGWRSEFFLRIARALPDRFSVCGTVTRNPAERSDFALKWGVKLYEDIDALVDQARPSFVVTSVPRSVNPQTIEAIVARGLPVLSETPPATDVPSLVAFYRNIRKAGGKVQVAEQYFLQPHHAARLAVIESGLIGTASQAQVSAAHGYHGVSLIRNFLGVTFEKARIAAREVVSPIVGGPGRDGPAEKEEIRSSKQLVAWIDFGDRLGVFDFAGEQYFSPVRAHRVLVRGERGEISGNRVSYLKDFRTPIHLDLTRHDTGREGDLEGHHLKGLQLGGEIVYTNPLAPARLSDDEIAVGACLLGMQRYVETGEDIYPLALACQDQYLDLLCQQAAETGGEMETETQAWCE